MIGGLDQQIKEIKEGVLDSSETYDMIGGLDQQIKEIKERLEHAATDLELRRYCERILRVRSNSTAAATKPSPSPSAVPTSVAPGHVPPGAPAAICFKTGLAHLEQNQLSDALSCFDEAFLALAQDQSRGDDIKAQATICAQYKIVVALLQKYLYMALLQLMEDQYGLRLHHLEGSSSLALDEKAPNMELKSFWR